MTAKTSQKLADVLRDAGLENLARRAEADEFHDFLTPHIAPTIELNSELAVLIDHAATSGRRKVLETIRTRLLDGEFDASVEESEEWAAGPEGQEIFSRLIRGD
jgi:hypothetical protein